jgi:hypothetical protein
VRVNQLSLIFRKERPEKAAVSLLLKIAYVECAGNASRKHEKMNHGARTAAALRSGRLICHTTPSRCPVLPAGAESLWLLVDTSKTGPSRAALTSQSESNEHKKIKERDASRNSCSLHESPLISMAAT